MVDKKKVLKGLVIAAVAVLLLLVVWLIVREFGAFSKKQLKSPDLDFCINSTEIGEIDTSTMKMICNKPDELSILPCDQFGICKDKWSLKLTPKYNKDAGGFAGLLQSKSHSKCLKVGDILPDHRVNGVPKYRKNFKTGDMELNTNYDFPSYLESCTDSPCNGYIYDPGSDSTSGTMYEWGSLGERAIELVDCDKNDDSQLWIRHPKYNIFQKLVNMKNGKLGRNNLGNHIESHKHGLMMDYAPNTRLSAAPFKSTSIQTWNPVGFLG